MEMKGTLLVNMINKSDLGALEHCGGSIGGEHWGSIGSTPLILSFRKKIVFSAILCVSARENSFWKTGLSPRRRGSQRKDSVLEGSQK